MEHEPEVSPDTERSLPRERPVRIPVPGGEITFTIHDMVVPFVLLLRLLMGWIFLWAGFEKAIDGFSAEGFLLHATSGPLQGWANSLGESGTALDVIEPLVTYSQILMGLAIFLGAVMRLALLSGAVMMFLFYIVQFPPEYDLFVDYYLVYIVVYAMLGALGAGRILGLDRYIERIPWVEQRPRLRYLLG